MTRSSFWGAAAVGVIVSLLGAHSFSAKARVRDTSSSSICYVSPNVLKATDFEYLGAMRVPYSGFGGMAWDTMQGGALSGRVVGPDANNPNAHVHIFMTGHNDTQVGMFEDTENYNQDYTATPRMKLLANYGWTLDRECSYTNTTGAPLFGNCNGFPNGQQRMESIFWSEANQLLYVTYVDGYNVSLRPDWSMYAAALTAPSGACASDPEHNVCNHTEYGPWRFTTPKGPGAQHGFILYGMLPDGSFGIGGTLNSGNSGNSWGPELFGGVTLPTATTPSSATAPDIAAGDTYVSYKYGGLDLMHDGSIIPGHTFQPLRRRAPYNDYNFNPPGDPTAVLNALNPGLNGGVGSFLDMERIWTGQWINLPDKQGMLFAGLEGYGDYWYGSSTQGPYNDTCQPGIQGPHATSYRPFWWIYNPADLMSVKTGAKNSWEIEPTSSFDPRTAIYPLQAACGGGALFNFRGSYFNPTTRRLYITTSDADPTAPGIYNHLIHVFHIK